MVVGAELEMTEGRLHAMVAARSLLDSLPYKLDVSSGLDGLKHPFDHNKNAMSDADSKESLVSRLASHPPSSNSHLQPFTAPWLAEVARITPARAEHLQFTPAPPAPSALALPDYYPQIHSLPPRAPYYPMFTTPHPYLRDYQPRPIQPYPIVDPRHTESSISVRSPPNASQLIPQTRLLGPPPPPPVPERASDLRESRSEASSSSLETQPRSLHGEPSPKRRNTQSSSFPFPPPASRTPHHRAPKTSPESHIEPSSLANSKTSPGCSLKPSSQTHQSAKLEESSGNEGAGSFYPHFQKGALVAVGSEVRKVEDMRTEDFIAAADATEDLTLDPPSVSSIVMASSGDTATITFNFMSRNTEMSVEPSVDHPFFVLNCGWSSCCPQKTFLKYGLSVRQLQVGDLCVSLTKTTVKQKRKQTASKNLKHELTQRSLRQPLAPPRPKEMTAELSSTMPPPSSTITTSSISSGSCVPYGHSISAAPSVLSPYAESSISKSHALPLSDSSPKCGGVGSPHLREDITSSSSPRLNVEVVVDVSGSPMNLSRSGSSPKMEHLNSHVTSPSSVARSSPSSTSRNSSSPSAAQRISPKPGSPKTPAPRCLAKKSQSPLSLVHSPKDEDSSPSKTPPSSSASSSSGHKDPSSIWRPANDAATSQSTSNLS